MKAYSNYKDCGVSGIEQIPKHWILEKIKFVATCNDEVLSDSTADDEIINYVEIGDVDYVNGITNPTAYEFKEAPSRARRITRPNDIIISTVRTYLKAIAKIAEPDLIVSTGFAVIRPRNIDEIFMSYALLAPTFIEEVMSRSFGVSYPAIKASSLMNIKICIPPLSEQKAIASFLDAKTKPIDDIIAKRKKQIELLEEMKSAIVSRAVTKGLNLEAKMKDSGIEWIGEIPDHWDVKCIKYIKASLPNAFVDGPFGSNLKSQHYVEDGDVYVIESGFITSGKFEYVRDMKTITEEHFETIKRSECKENDIIIAKIGAYFGMAAVLPKLDKKSVVSGNSLKITLDNTIMLNDIFVYLMACSKKQNGYIGVVNETAQPALSLYNLNHFKLPVAPLEEQEAIASYLDSETSKIDSRIAKRRKQIELLQEYKQALITAAVTGKIDVREYNS